MENPFKNISKKINNIARATVLASTLAGSAYQANAEQPKNNDKKVEQIQEVKIDEAKLTESGKLFREILNSAKTDLGKIENQEDANLFIRSHFGEFVSQYYIPTKGITKDGAYGTKTRDYSNEDLKLMLGLAQELKSMVEGLNSKFQVEAYQSRIDQINTLIKTLKDKSSFAGQKRKELLDKYQN